MRVVHHEVNRGYGGALRSGFEASRYELLCFTDGDRQFRVADLARLTARMAEAGPTRTSSSGTGSSAPTRSSGSLYARTYKLANRIFFGLRVKDVDCACKLFRRESLEGVRVESGGAFFSAELLIRTRNAGRSIVEVGVPHYPRTAGSPTGAKPSVIWRAVKDFWMLRLRLWANRERALRRGSPILGAQESRAALAGGAAAARVLVHVERVHELAEDVEARLVERLAGRLEGRPRTGARRPSPSSSSSSSASGEVAARSRTSDVAKIGADSRTASAIASDGRASISLLVSAPTSRMRAWNVSSARSEMTIRSMRTSSGVEHVDEQVVGERPLRRDALELHRDRVRLVHARPRS